MADERTREPPVTRDEPPDADDVPEPPPPGVRRMAIVRWLILALSVVIAGASWYVYASDRGATVASVLYQCPMHPEIVSERPGECPICHMDLEKVSADRIGGGQPSAPTAQPTPSAAPHAKPGQYTCPMHPEVVSDHPGRCPKCKMDLVRVEPKAETPTAKPGQYTCPMHPEVVSDEPGSCPKCKMDLVPVKPKDEAASLPQGTSELGLTLDRVQAIGVRTATVQEVAAGGAVRAPAIVEAPEQTAARVHVRAAGFVEAIAVNQTGVRVKSGQRLFSLYSPEIYQAQSELLATQNWPVLGHPSDSHEVGARRKLELLGVPASVAEKVLSTKQPTRTVDIVAPAAGYVTQKNVTLGSFVTPDMTLYEIVDLSKVYIVADLFQVDADAVKVGTRGTFRLRRGAAPPLEATVDLIYPQVNVASRTTRVRMTVKNPERGLLPGEYGIVEFAVDSAKASVVIPADALIDTGTQQYVFVQRSPGHYSPRLVHVIGEAEGGFELRGGVNPGDIVVSGAAFLLDSESRLRASLARGPAAVAAPNADPPSPAGSAEHRH